VAYQWPNTGLLEDVKQGQVSEEVRLLYAVHSVEEPANNILVTLVGSLRPLNVTLLAAGSETYAGAEERADGISPQASHVSNCDRHERQSL
jgi:hypothetical protein